MSPEEFTRQITPLRDKLYRFALHLGLSEAQAEDATQDALCKLWSRRQSVDKPAAWCMRLLRNYSIDLWRKHGREERLATGHEHSPTPEDSPEVQVERAEALRRIAELMRTLPEKQQQVMHLRDVEDLSYEEIRAELGLTLNQVRVYLHRARTRIKEEMIKIYSYEG